MSRQEQLNLKAKLFDKLASLYIPSGIDESELSEALGQALKQACQLGYFDASVLIDHLKVDS